MKYGAREIFTLIFFGMNLNSRSISFWGKDNFRPPFKKNRPSERIKFVGKFFFKDNVFKHEQDYVETSMQITKFSSKTLDVINVYRSSNGHSVELLNHLQDILTKEKAVLITRDFNICYQTISNNRLSKGLETRGFIQLVKEATHIRGGHIYQRPCVLGGYWWWVEGTSAPKIQSILLRSWWFMHNTYKERIKWN